MRTTELETARLILRRWTDADADALFKYAQNPDVANPAGWPPHSSVDVSRQIIKEVFSAPLTYAVVLKETGEPVGCCGIVPPGSRPNVKTGGQDAEIGYWIGKAYWGNGLIPEAVNAICKYCFKILDKQNLWISFYEFNANSRRVAKKCGFTYHHTEGTDSMKEIFYIRRNCTIDIICADRDKRQYMSLLLIGDESERMIERYLDRGTLFVGLLNDSPVAVCLITEEGDGIIEIKNLAVRPDCQKRGFGRAMIAHIERTYPGMTITLGTGETPSTLKFYHSLGFTVTNRIPDFFTQNYDSPIIEEGVLLKDMVYLSKQP